MLAVLSHLVGTEFEVVALAPPEGLLHQSLERLGVPTLPFNVRSSDGERRNHERVLEDLDAAMRRVKPDLVHGNSLSMARLTGTLAAGSKTVVTAHLRDMIGLSAAAVSQLNSNRVLVAVSNAVRDYHAGQGVDRSRLRVVYNGVERSELPAQTGWLKDELGVPRDSFLIAVIGQICLRKGQDVFAQAAAEAASQMPASRFLLIGERYSTKMESVALDESLTFEFAVARLAERFHRLGYRADVARLLPELDLIVHCARQEPFARVLLEAAAAGSAIIATNVGGTEEMLVNEESALLVPPDAPGAVAAAMVRLYRDPELRSRLGSAARERVTAQFPIEKAARGLAEIWRTAIHG